MPTQIVWYQPLIFAVDMYDVATPPMCSKPPFDIPRSGDHFTSISMASIVLNLNRQRDRRRNQRSPVHCQCVDMRIKELQRLYVGALEYQAAES